MAESEQDLSKREHINPNLLLARIEKVPHGDILADVFFEQTQPHPLVMERGKTPELVSPALVDPQQLAVGIKLRRIETGYYFGNETRIDSRTEPVEGASLDFFDSPDALFLPVRPFLTISHEIVWNSDGIQIGFHVARYKPPPQRRFSQWVNEVIQKIARSGIPITDQPAIR